MFMARGSALAAEGEVRSKEADLGKKAETHIPEASLAGDISRKKAKKEEKEAPALEYDQFRIQIEVQVAGKRREQIDTLQKIIKVTDCTTPEGKNECPDLHFRLSELYWEESRSYFFDANRKDDDIIKAKVAKDKAAQEAAEREKKELLKKRDYYSEQAMLGYKTIIQKYPKFSRMDEVLFFLGHNLWEQGREEDALKAYKKMITDHGQSKYVPDAWVAFGQHFFQNSKGKKDELAKALEAFKRAAAFTDNPVYGYALYMQGWCHYNLGDFNAAMDMFKAVILFSELQGGQKTKEAQKIAALAREARKDYVLAYSHVGDPLAARADFEKVGGSEYFGMLKGLAGLYFDDGKDKEATIVYRMLIKERPCHAETPFYQGRIVDALIRVGNKRLTVEQVRELVRMIQRVEKECPPKSDEDKKSFADSKGSAEKYLSNLAVNWHNEAKKTRDEQTFSLTNEVYNDYLSVFPDTAKSYDLRFFYAELLNDNLQKYDRAAEEYSRVCLTDIDRIDPPKDADGKPKHPPEKAGRWMQNACYDAILAYDEVAKKFEQNEQPPPQGKTTPIPKAKKDLLIACERYIKYVRGDKQVEILYKAANIYYRYNAFDKAVDLFSKIALDHPEHELAEYSVNLVLDSYNLQNNLEKVVEWARKFVHSEALLKAHPKLREDLAKVLEQTSFKLVNEMEKTADPKIVAEKYLQFVNDFPKSDLASDALFNASENFIRAHMLDRAVETRKEMIAKYPNSPYVAQAIYSIASAADTMADFRTAAEYYEMYFKDFEKQNGGPPKAGAAIRVKRAKPAAEEKKGGGKFDATKAQNGLFNAGIYREGLGQPKKAMEDRNAYLAAWPDAKDAEQVFLSIADLYEKEGQLIKAEKQIEDYEKKYCMKDPSKMLGMEQRLVRMFEKHGNKGSATKIVERAFKDYEHLPPPIKRKVEGPGIEPVARAMMVNTEKDFVAYTKVKITAKDQKDFKDSGAAKAKALKELSTKYTEIVKLKAGDPAICALYKLGLANQQMVEAALNTPPYDVLKQPEVIEKRKKVDDQIKKKLYEALRKDNATVLVPYLVKQVPHEKIFPKSLRTQVPPDVYNPLLSQVKDLFGQVDQEFKNLEDDFKSNWKVNVEKSVEGPKQNAIEALTTAIDKARELDIFNDCAKKSQDLLRKLQAEQVPPSEDELMPIKLPGETHAGGAPIAEVQPIPKTAPLAKSPVEIDGAAKPLPPTAAAATQNEAPEDTPPVPDAKEDPAAPQKDDAAPPSGAQEPKDQEPQ
jgi:cellulose synthase operon protein C